MFCSNIIRNEKMSVFHKTNNDVIVNAFEVRTQVSKTTDKNICCDSLTVLILLILVNVIF